MKSKRACDYVDHYRKGFEKMRNHKLKLNPLKCVFGIKAGNFLGFLVHQRGIEIDKSIAKAIREAQSSRNKK